jgi:hypothetical protein
MKTWPMIRSHARRLVTSGALILAATLLASGTTIGSEADGRTTDPATQAAWLQDHFRCEYGAEMTDAVAIDMATQAAWLQDHFRCEHGAEMDLA